jgi:hypothetical protein
LVVQTVPMSPVSRGRRGKRNTQSGRPNLVVVSDAGNADECDCPACSGAEVSPEQLVDELVGGAVDLIACEDPVEAELTGAIFVVMSTAVDGEDGTLPLFARTLIPAIEARGDEAALALLTAIGAAAGAGPVQLAEAAGGAADRLTAGGLPAPGWARKLAEPLRAGPFARLYDAEKTMSVLVGTFQRADHEHAVMIVVDHDDCGAAADILVLDGAELSAVLDQLRDSGRRDGLTIKTEKVSAPEFRWYAEQAMEARAVHDDEDTDDGSGDLTDLLDEDEGPGYDVLAVLVRGRLAALPQPRQPKGAVVIGHGAARRLQEYAQLAVPADFGLAFGAVKLPPKRKKADGPAPLFQLKVSLCDAKPPIWRRLVVPGNISLAGLNRVILAAFGWAGSHLHVFETEYGEFGVADRELGHRAEGPVTLEQIAPEPKDKFRYTYDFGDGWTHEILVEKVLAPDSSGDHPRCIGGRRAAPPDDCGGVWGYASLVEALADPKHPEHEERLEWLGLTEAGEFTPEAFDVEEVNERLRDLR